MSRERPGRGLAFLALAISLVALGVSIYAYREVGGTQSLREQVQALQQAAEAARKDTADALARMEKAIRPAGR
jgi:hypothetical protein